MVDVGRPVLSVWVAEECKHISEQELTEGAERTFSDLVRKANVKELEAWDQFRVCSPAKPGTQPKDLVDTRWALAWKEVESEKTVKARLVAKGYQDPDLRIGSVDIADCVSRRSSHLQVIFREALKKWPLWSLDIKNASLQADGFHVLRARGIPKVPAVYGNRERPRMG